MVMLVLHTNLTQWRYSDLDNLQSATFVGIDGEVEFNWRRYKSYALC
jgi:hypothetical protein